MTRDSGPTRAEVCAAALADCFRDDSVCLVEWPERVAGLLPEADLDVMLAHASLNRAGRELSLQSATALGKRCRDAIEAALTPAPR